MPTPLQQKVDAIQAKVDDNNAKKQPNYTNVMDPATGKPTIATAPLTGANQPAPTPPVVTTSQVRNEFDKNAAKLDTVVNTTQAKIDAAKAQYGEEAYNKSVAGKTVNVTGGQPTTTTPSTTTTTTPEGESEYVKTQREIENQRKMALEKLDASGVERQNLYDAMMAKSDASHQDLLTSIKTQFDQTRNKMADTNSRFNAMTSQNQYLVNGFRYTPQQAEGMVYDTEQAGLAKLGALDSQYSAALTAAQTAKDERDYKNLNGLMDNLDKLQKDRLGILNDMALGAKQLSESIDSVENMNQNQLTAMNNMMEGFGIDFEDVPAADKEAWYKARAEEVSNVTGTKISAEYVKSQMSRYNKQAQQEMRAPDINQSAMFGYYVNKNGQPILNFEGQPIHFSPNDKTVIDPKTGKMTISTPDEYGNTTVTTTIVPGLGDDLSIDITGDLSNTAWVNKYPREASFKNNNPGGFSMNPSFQQYFNTGKAPAGSTAELWAQNGINFSPGNERGAMIMRDGKMVREGGQYVKFATIEDGLRAMKLWWEAKDTTIDQQLKSYSEAGYKLPGYEGKKFKDLTEDQKQQFMLTQIRKESPGLYQAIKQSEQAQYNPASDADLQKIGSSPEGDLYKDSRTGKTITGNEAKEMYGQKVLGKTYTQDESSAMDSIIGEPTKAQIEALAKQKLTMSDLEQYRKQKRTTGDYSVQDQDFITKNDDKVQKTAVYKDINESQKYISNLLNLLDRGSGIGDIGAINQFQKIIDEGAVTRDQDVKLIQGAESILGKMQLWLKNKKEGDQLTPAQREEMRTIAKQMLEGKRKIFENDPGVKAIKKALESRGIDPNAGIFGELWQSNMSSSSGGTSTESDPLGIL